ncbi:MAG: hypothetical protein ACRENK_16455 [Gemmatimonadaceae bacterium]
MPNYSHAVPKIYARPYNSFPILEASGAKAGHPEDASVGMPHMMTASNEPWAWNQMMGQWQYCHTIKSGDTLFKLSGLYYGTSSLSGVHAIYGVPQNKSIQGPSPDSGLIPGDVILIPGLPQPSTAPAAADTIPMGVPDLPPIGMPLPTSAGSPMPAPVVSGSPQGWPTDLPYPPVSMPAGTTIDYPSDTLPEVTVVGDVPPGSTEPFWTNGRIAIAAGAGVLGLGTIVWLATRKKKRRRAA